jgi:hypothetical protein
MAVFEREVVEVEAAGKGIWRIRWLAFKGSLDITTWFDQETGYSPIRRESRYTWYRPTPPLPQETSEATWMKVSGVWVPKSLVLERTIKTGHVKIDVAFEWESVNEPVPEAVFQTGSMLPAGESAQVISTELGRPVVLETIKGGPPHERTGDEKPASSSIPRHGIRRWVIPLNIFILLALVGTYYWRRRLRA